MINTIPSFNSYSQFMGGAGNYGKLYIPVEPAQVLYTQFDHISGYASKQISDGVSIDKIRILNTLIDQLVSIKKLPETAKTEVTLSDDQIDAQIQAYETAIKTTQNAAQTNPYVLTPAVNQGILFDISA